MKKLVDGRIILFLIVLVILGLIGNLFKRNWQGNNDFKMGVISDKRMELISISPERKMVSVLKINEGVPVWIPGGLGWYKSDSIKKILDQENKRDKLFDIFFYNFGFTPEKISYLSNENDWKRNLFLLKNMGLVRWFKYVINSNQVIIKEDSINNNLVEEKSVLDEIMARDFADSRIVNEELRLSVFNTTAESGLAGFIGRNLEWAGFSVISTESVNEEISKCVILSNDKMKNVYGWTLLKQIFSCDVKESNELNDNEVEIYFGEDYAQMLKYSNYTN